MDLLDVMVGAGVVFLGAPLAGLFVAMWAASKDVGK